MLTQQPAALKFKFDLVKVMSTVMSEEQ